MVFVYMILYDVFLFICEYEHCWEYGFKVYDETCGIPYDCKYIGGSWSSIFIVPRNI